MSKESAKSNRAATPSRRPISHDQPVIITGGSVTLEFDGSLGPQYYAELSSSRYIAIGLHITSVSVRVDPGAVPGTGRRCPGVPTHGLCTVIIEGRHEQNHDDSAIRVVGQPGFIDISFNGSHYQKNSGTAPRKGFHSAVRRIQSLSVINNLTQRVEDCTHLLPNDRRCFIDIMDDHLFDNLEALAEQRELLLAEGNSPSRARRPASRQRR